MIKLEDMYLKYDQQSQEINTMRERNGMLQGKNRFNEVKNGKIMELQNEFMKKYSQLSSYPSYPETLSVLDEQARPATSRIQRCYSMKKKVWL